MVDSKIHPRGNCGFRFKLVYPITPTSKFSVRLRKQKLKFTLEAKEQKEKLPTNPVSNLNGQELISGKGKTFFIHIPKTAGTSMRMMLYDVFEQESILPNQQDIKKNGGKYPTFDELLGLVSTEQKTRIQLVAGHYPFIPNAVFASQPQIFTFLREPIARVISNLFHIKKHKTEYYKHSLEEVFHANLRQMQNMQVRYLAGTVRKRTLDQSDFNHAIRNMNSCQFVGITENFDESIDILENLFNWKFPERMRTNVNHTKKTAQVPDALMEKIIEANKLDVKLYNEALILFEKRKQQILNPINQTI